jgi:type I restriction-modification system DNA methylase subunit
MNSGRVQPGKAEIHAYNGGLFAEDPLLDSLKISDALLKKHVSKLTEYDFQSEVDTNILGHIFEHSLNDIENVRASLEGTAVDKSKTKRKKDGVFYTPKYITKYIVENTVGKLCKEKKAELAIVDEEFSVGTVYKTREAEKKRKGELNEKLIKYRNWLLQLSVCDPACGSGAFLNQVLEFLMAEHHYLDELESMLFGTPIVFPNVENHILENNIFGVDINEESVEIARLSLWLRTAQKGRKLSTLSSNIKVGNSLIDDPEVAGELAFNWQNEFPQVFAKGGFDVVVGNPPYVGEKGHSEIFNSLKKIPKWLEYYRRRSNLYYFFIKLGLELLKNSGRQSLIIPREFISADWSNKVRLEILRKSKLISIVDFNDLKVFDDAGTSSLIITHSKEINNDNYDFDFMSLRDQELIPSHLLDQSLVSKYSSKNLDNSGIKTWNFYQDEFDSFNTDCTLSKYYDISQGLVTGADKVTPKHIVNNLISKSYLGRGIFILTKDIDIKIISDTYQLLIKDQWVTLSIEEKRFIKQFIKTENLNKWYVTESSSYIIYGGKKKIIGAIKDYLLQFAGILLNRSTTIPEEEIINLYDFENFSLEEIKEKYSSAGAVQKIMRSRQWWLPLYERGDVPFENPKIIVNTKNMDKFTYSDGPHYSSGGGAGGQNYIYI